MQRTFTAWEATQNFWSILAQVEAGNEAVVTSGGRPIARIVPFETRGKREMTPERRVAIERMRALMDEGADLGGLKIDRGELYDRP